MKKGGKMKNHLTAIVNDLNDVLSCYDKRYHPVIAHTYLNIYGRELIGSEKGYILIKCNITKGYRIK